MRFVLLAVLLGAVFGCSQESAEQWCLIPGGTIQFGSEAGMENERPALELRIKDFYLSATEVRNAQFQVFVDATNYTTDAERVGASMVFVEGKWELVKGADWKHPYGPNSSISGRKNFPVVHVSYNDAKAYCAWKSVRLPSEIELECALQKTKRTLSQMNITRREKQAEMAPADNGTMDELGCFHLAGNVWEWCEDVYNYEIHDKWSVKASHDLVYRGKSFDPLKVSADTLRVMKGGSFLCQEGFCAGYLPHARQSCEQSASYFHLGFRVAKDLP